MILYHNYMDRNKQLDIYLMKNYMQNRTFMLLVISFLSLLVSAFIQNKPSQTTYNKTFIQFVGILANEAFRNLKLFKKQQSILITGVSGSGKTENGKHIVEFLCHTKCDSQNIIDSGQIFEAFGNARTRGNSNSSRFCKHMEVFDQSYYSFFFVSIHFNWFPIIGYV